MKFHILFVIALLLVINSILLSQSGWFQQNSGTNNRLYTCFFINDQTGFAGGANGTILKTTNGGSYWYNIYNQQFYNVYALYFSQNIGWAVISDNRGFDSCFVLRTIDYGLTWNKYFTDTKAIYFELADIQFINNVTGYISKSNFFLKTTDGGASWNNTSETFCAGLYFINNETGWVGRTGFYLTYTSNGGSTWSQQMLIHPHQYAVDLFFFNSQTGFCISRTWGYAGPLNYTSNGGSEWIPRFDLYEHDYIEIQFLNPNTGYMLALYYTDYSIARSSNGGVNWNHYNFDTPEYLTKLFFSSINTGWVVGDSGTIMKTTTGGVPIGIQQIGTNMPRDFSLSQNYPNPFNPSTIIKFDISGRSAAQTFLSVYDILGREVAVLVNEQLKPGTYEVDFDGTNYPSGVYFYKLQAENFTETRKMLILK